MKRVWSLVLVVFLVFLMGISAMASEYHDNYLTISFIDVRMGDCILLSCDGENMLIDGGTYGRGGKRVKNYFDQTGLEKLDYMFNTHYHEDHIGGLYWLLRHDFPVDKYLSPYSNDFKWDKTQIKVQKLVQKNGIQYVQIAGGEEMSLGSARLEFFQDTSEGIGTNGHSIVTMVTFGKVKILLMADAGGLAQRHLLAKYGAESFKADILKYAHHGYMPMVKEFMDAVDPDLVIVTNNSKAASECEKQLEKRNINRFYTQKGTVVVETDGQIWSVCQMP